MKLRALQQQLKALQSLRAMDHVDLDRARYELALAQDEVQRQAQGLTSIKDQCAAILQAQQQGQKAGARMLLGPMALVARQYQSAFDILVERQAGHDEALRYRNEHQADVARRQAALDALDDRCRVQRRACGQEQDRLEALMLEDLWLGQRFMEERDHAGA